MSKNPPLQSIFPTSIQRKIHAALGFGAFDSFEPKNVELFAGAGGFGAGAMLAGLKFDIAINHNPAALAVHKVNFPHTTQMINDVFEHNPIDVLIASGVPFAIFSKIRNWRSSVIEFFAVYHLHLSPDCTFHSRAKGKKKVLARHTICGDECSLVDHTQLSQETADRIRGLAWVALGWAAVARPRRITLENVVEFLEWGPTTIDKDGDVVPDATRAGETFDAFKSILSTGIDKKHPAIKEMRKFLKPFLGDEYNEDEFIKGLGYDVEFKELTACAYGAPTSRKRLFMIARCDGIEIKWPEPTHGEPNSLEVKQGKLFPFRGAAECINWDVASPSIFETKEDIMQVYGIRVKRPLVSNSMRRIAYGLKKFVLESESPYRVEIQKGNLKATPYIQTYYGETANNFARGNFISNPLHTITSGGQRHGLVVPYITGIDNASSGKYSVWSGERPLTTIVTEARHALTVAYIVNSKGTCPRRMPIGNKAVDPITTITAHDSHGVVMAHLSREFGQSIGSSIYKPLPTITAGGGGKTSLVISRCLLKKQSNSIELLSDEKRYKAWQVARMMEVYADYKVPMIGSIPLPRAQFLKVKSGEIIYDVGMRMLTERELFTGQGFQKSFVYDPEVEVTASNGKKSIRKITKTEAVRMVGNSVPPHFATAIIAALDEAEYIDQSNREEQAS